MLVEGAILLYSFLLFPTIWGSLDRRRVHDTSKLQLLEKEKVKRVEATMVPILEDLL